ncbi:hypothetical protein GGH94_004827 [Coemansia aciculifera]|uniref:Uncharacterized protein n=1 Tax=Coemansia aciculifera TaxID=417176 RepID=A0A9W8IF23_9FUNG|nr:hypothetical protein GGH94_004827 [Coemansia aciculifera]
MSLGTTAASTSVAAASPAATNSPLLSIALTRNQYALECGGVLLDPSTNEVCLLFYPDSSEWRLPIGRPDAMVPPTTDTSYVPAAASVSGCEPPSHSAQRLITQITGYRCTHLHPLVADCKHNACAYIGPQMVEPLALQIEQRTSVGSPQPPTSDDMVDDTDEHQPRLSPACQYVMTCYYMAWLTQSRFEQRAATLPVGPANGHSARQSMPMAEVTWFKMDTAAQVLSHASDKLALREAIHRMTRGDVPRQPFTYSTILQAPAPAQTEIPEITEEPPASQSDAASSAESSAGFSDAATKTGTTSVTPTRVVSPPGVRNLDILRKTATSLSKRGGLLIRSGRNSTTKDEDSDDSAKKSPPATASMPLVTTSQAAAAATRPASTPQDLVVRTKPHFPRVLSIFYKLVGSSSS